jgi:hypothetical protein
MEIRGTAANDEADALHKAEIITHSIEARIPNQNTLFGPR